MATPKTVSIVQQPAGNVATIADRFAPPDTMGLTVALQTTLDVGAQMRILARESAKVVEFDHLAYRHAPSGTHVSVGRPGPNVASYELTLEGESLGRIRFTAKRRFAEHDLMRLEYLLATLLHPLRNALQFDAVKQAAYKDPLTGVGNRAAMEDALQREIELAQRNRTALTLLAIDLDHFKRINDQHGHSAGDVVLRSVAERMRAATRASDLLFRYGGEEFVAVLAHTELSKAKLVAERIRRAVADRPIVVEGGALSITVSLGIAGYADRDQAKQLFDKADEALYAAKRAGRNRAMLIQRSNQPQTEAEDI